MILTESLMRYAANVYSQRQPYLGSIADEIGVLLKKCPEEERILMQFLYGTLPLRDAGDVPFDILLDYVRHALYLRREAARCRDLPESIFLKYVLYPRIHTEQITACRSYFYQEVRDRIRGMSTEAAALEINWYCAEHASYHASDLRTLAPVYVCAYGSGRCGEESVFTVSVLRAAGIPARQVYVPLWAHCDDNHAWVEVLLQDSWHYMGACEPEAALDRGWFDGAASRAMIIHTRNYTDYGEEEEVPRPDRIGRSGGVYYYNLTGSYARTVQLTVNIREEDGSPAAGASVSFELLNMAEYRPIASMSADALGRVCLHIGLGSVRICACRSGREAHCLVDTADSSMVTMVLHSAAPVSDTIDTEYFLRAPREAAFHAVHSAPALEEAARRRNAECELLRKRSAGEYLAARQQHLQMTPERLLMLLSDKDRKDISDAVLEDTGLAMEYEKLLPRELFDTCVLNPRIWYEELVPWRQFLDHFLSPEEKSAFRKDPGRIVSWITERITSLPQTEDSSVYATPIGALQTGHASPASQRILSVAICRTLGIPARLNSMTQEPEYYDDEAGAFCELQQAHLCGRTAQLVLEGVADLTYGIDWSIGRKNKADKDVPEYQTLRLEGLQEAAGQRDPRADPTVCSSLRAAADGEFSDEIRELVLLRQFERDDRPGSMSLNLIPGEYRIVLTARRPDGSQQVRELLFLLQQGEHRTLALVPPQIPLSGFLVEIPMEEMLEEMLIEEISAEEISAGKSSAGEISPEEAALLPDRHRYSSLQKELEGCKSLILVLHPGQEPSAHVVNELLSFRESFPSDLNLVTVVTDNTASTQGMLSQLCKAIPRIKCCLIPDPAVISRLARHVYVDPEQLPLLLLLDKNYICRYGSSGYRVGQIAQTLRLSSLLP